jgi:tetratricopeptide (TPR) repeat protein
MAYNKSKFVEAAQKLLNQGKVAQAIAEYQQILKFEPRDQVTLMTVGELYIRQGETFQAIDYFERLAQIFVADGFLTKAIAVYKRIAKLAPEEIRPLEKLADLYVQQGVMSEARPLFLQLAEIHLKHNRQPEAVNLLKKLLVAEPDNLRIQVRLADLYQAMGLAKDAMDTYVSAAQRALARGDQAECERLADKALKLDPASLAAVIVKARSYSARGNVTQAAELLESVPNLEKGGEQAELLLDLYLKTVNWEKATALALRIFEADSKNFGLTQKVTEAMLQANQGEMAMPIIERTRIPMLDAGEHEAVGRILNELVARLPGRIEPHEWLVDSYGRTSDSFRLPDALAQFGDALVANGKLERAKEVFEQLVDREPDSDSAKRKLNDLLQKMGIATDVANDDDNLKTELEPPPAPKVRPDVEAAPPENSAYAVAGQLESSAPLDEETQKFIAQSLTDVDLFASYGLTQKAIGLLEAILRRAPRHTPTLEKLLDFVLGAGDDRRTAELAARLEKLHSENGDNRSAERFAELRRRFQRAAGMSDAELVAASQSVITERGGTAESGEEVIADEEIAAFEVAPEPAVTSEPAQHEVTASQVAGASSQDVHEVDLSDEWLSVLKEVEPETAASPKATEEQPVAEQAAPEFAIADAAQPSGPTEFEISVEPAPADEPEFAASDSNAESARPTSAAVPPADMPAYAEFQVAPEPAAPETEKPALPSEEKQEISFELAEPAEIASSAPVAEATADVAKQGQPAAQVPVEEFSLSPEPEELEEIAAPEPPSQQVAAESLKAAEPQAGKEQVPEPVAPEKDHSKDKSKKPAEESEFELDQDYELVLEPESLVPAYDQKPPDVPIQVNQTEDEPEPAVRNAAAGAAGASGESSFGSDQFMADLASEIEHLGMGQLTPPSARGKSEAPVKSIDASNQSDSGPLKEVFDDFRAELGEMGADDEDLETHYNLGTAFREMGLLEEAISEFQKVAKANERGRPFRYAMQCCTLLGLAFMEKGQPAIAAIWYERALQTPGVEPESILALRYDLGIAQESAGEPEAALKSFSKVYAMNIDYRDVAERIAALQKPSR